MNPGSFFREVSESREFRSSDIGAAICETTHVFEHIIFTSDNANLLDIEKTCKAGRFAHHIVDESAARD